MNEPLLPAGGTKSSASSDTPSATPIDALGSAIVAGDRRALARAITLVESERAEDIVAAASLLAALLPHSGKAMRIGISGPPGAGKSTFIEAFGLHLVGLGKRVAVLAIDPSSSRSGGSILGDKTRMADLARHPLAFIRPSPSRGALGGVAQHTREALLLCEAAGFDAIIVETVGVGQSETVVAEMVDLFTLILSPGGGDELQGLKRGIVELAELFIVNKADGDLIGPAQRLAGEYQNALHLLRPLTPAWHPEIHLVSSLDKRGIDKVWETMERHRKALGESGELERRRRQQSRAWLWRAVQDGVYETLRADGDTRALAADLEAEVEASRLSPAAAAARLIAAFRGR